MIDRLKQVCHELDIATAAAKVATKAVDRRLARPEYLLHRSKTTSLSDPDYDRKMTNE